MFTLINCLLLDNLLLWSLRAVWSESLLVAAVASVPTLLVKRLSTLSGSVFLNDEIRGSIQIGLSRLSGRRNTLFQRLHHGELTDVREDLSSTLVFFGPLGDIIIGFLLLKTLENNLVFPCNFHKFTFASFSVETFLELDISDAACLGHLL